MTNEPPTPHRVPAHLRLTDTAVKATVGELIAELQKLDPDLALAFPVIADPWLDSDGVNRMYFRFPEEN